MMKLVALGMAWVTDLPTQPFPLSDAEPEQALKEQTTLGKPMHRARGRCRKGCGAMAVWGDVVLRASQA
jgi:hypothetical protein